MGVFWHLCARPHWVCSPMPHINSTGRRGFARPFLFRPQINLLGGLLPLPAPAKPTCVRCAVPGFGEGAGAYGAPASHGGFLGALDERGDLIDKLKRLAP